VNTKVLLGACLITALAALGQPAPARAFTYLDPLTDKSTATGWDSLDPYISLKGVTYGQGSGGSKNFQEYNSVTYVDQYGGFESGIWQDSQPGSTTFDFWANNGNNPVVSLRIGGIDYLGVVSGEVKDKGNNTLAFQWSQIDADAWYNNKGQILAANDPATYLLWITDPILSDQSTSSDPPLTDLNKELSTQRTANSTTTEGVPAPLPVLALPVLFGFIPKLRKARMLNNQGTTI
jgi:hypothetical protein